MRCSRVQFLYEDYSAGILEAATASRVDLHLADCPSCREYFEESDDISQILSASSEVVHPGNAYLDDLTSRVMESLYDETGEFRPQSPRPAEVLEFSGRSPQRALWWAGAVAAALLMAPVLAGIANRPSDLGRAPATQVTATASQASGTTVSKSVQRPRIASSQVLSRARNLEPGVWGSALPLGQGLVYNAIRPVSMNPSRPGAVPALPPAAEPKVELGTIEELLALEAVGTVEARQRIIGLLRDLGQTLHDQYPELERSTDYVLMKQTHLYHRAETGIQKGEIERAAEAYGHILEINPTTILGRRAAMRLADLHYYKLGDFDEALNFYRKAEDETAQLALTEDEARHVTGQRIHLEKHASDSFALLSRVHDLVQAPWSETPARLRSLTADSEAAELASDIATGLMNRMAAGSLPDDEIAFDLVDLIESTSGSWDNPESKSWLRLLMGDIIWLKFESSEPALEAYRSVQGIHEGSEPARLAQRRIDLLRNDKVVVFGR